MTFIPPAMPDASRYRDRVTGLAGTSMLDTKTVVLVGLGSVGSDMGAKLVRLGVRVIGCDADNLAVENLIRWGLPASIECDVGKPKSAVWRDMLRRTVPGARVEGHAVDIVRGAVMFDRIVVAEKPDLLIAATDTKDSRRQVNAMAARHGIAALFIGLSDGASSVRIEVVESARRGPCHLCAVHAEGTSSVSDEKQSRVPYQGKVEPFAEAVPALPVDIALGTAVATRIALAMLGVDDWRMYMKNGAQRGNVLFLSMRPDHWIFDGAYDRFVYGVEKNPECPTCGDREEVIHG